jgi:hypothetical protein
VLHICLKAGTIQGLWDVELVKWFIYFLIFTKKICSPQSNLFSKPTLHCSLVGIPDPSVCVSVGVCSNNTTRIACYFNQYGIVNVLCLCKHDVQWVSLSLSLSLSNTVSPMKQGKAMRSKESLLSMTLWIKAGKEKGTFCLISHFIYFYMHILFCFTSLRGYSFAGDKMLFTEVGLTESWKAMLLETFKIKFATTPFFHFSIVLDCKILSYNHRTFPFRRHLKIRLIENVITYYQN